MSSNLYYLCNLYHNTCGKVGWIEKWSFLGVFCDPLYMSSHGLETYSVCNESVKVKCAAIRSCIIQRYHINIKQRETSGKGTGNMGSHIETKELARNYFFH